MVRNLTVAYNAAPVLRSAGLEVPDGSMMAIIGPNGAGKSTLLKAALGLIRPLSGEVLAWGTPLPRQRDRIAYVPQRASVDWDFPTTVFDATAMGLYRDLGLLRRMRARHREAVMSCLERVGMQDLADRQIGQLSGGQQQRVFLARALAQRADLYLLDEPFAGVDAATEAAIIGVLHGLRDAGKTILCVHHDLSTVEAYYSHICLLNRQTVAQGPTATTFTKAHLAETYDGRLPAMA